MEKEFIEQVSIDCVIFGYRERKLYVLILTLKNANNLRVLPSGYVGQEEDIDFVTQRVLETRIGLTNAYVEQFYTFGKAGRSTKEEMERLDIQEQIYSSAKLQDFKQWATRRFISVGYYALVDMEKASPQVSGIDESCEWLEVDDLPKLAFDHNEMVMKAFETLQVMLDPKRLVFKLLPETFTMKDMQDVYETVLQEPFRRNNFQKKMLDFNILERLEKKFTGTANKPPYLYRVLPKEV
jgi:8-oxo-dGTP diphosphatase